MLITGLIILELLDFVNLFSLFKCRTRYGQMDWALWHWQEETKTEYFSVTDKVKESVFLWDIK